LNEITEFSDIADSIQQPLSPVSPIESTNGHVGFTTLPAKINSKTLDWSPHENGHQNGTYGYSSVRQTPILDSPSMDSGNWGDLRDTSKTPLTGKLQIKLVA
jgi:hypothetical protein